jgi:alpha-D-ribose 1-methylphosphonate 5-triphosphate synthase subunit PhnI
MSEKETSDTTGRTPTALPPDVMDASDPRTAQVERPLHLRVLRAMIEGQVDEGRVDQALALAQEVYELELANFSLETYRSAS